jgi:hypothetical protein
MPLSSGASWTSGPVLASDPVDLVQLERRLQRAFEMLRDEARRSNRKLIEIAEAVTMRVNLLPRSSVE